LATVPPAWSIVAGDQDLDVQWRRGPRPAAWSIVADNQGLDVQQPAAHRLVDRGR